MQIVDTLKKAPKWAWFTAAGVGVGAAVIKVYNDRDAPEAEPVVGEIIGDPVYAGTGGTPGVIVPPVIVSGGGGDDVAAGALSELYMGGIQQFMAGFQDLASGWEALAGGATAALANAGSAPPSALQQATPVVSAQPAPQLAPAPVPAPAPAPTQPAAAPAPAKKCSGEYPFLQDNGPRAGMCYKVVKKDGKRYRFYSNGDKVLAPA